jgi:transposase
LDRTQPLLPLDFRVTEQRTHDYQQHGITNIFAALDVATGQVTTDCQPVRNGVRFLAFLRKAVKPHAGKQIHVVLDNLSTHDTPDVRAWLAANPNVTFHFTPTGSSWLNMIEIWFGIITRQAIRRGTFTSVNALIVQIATTSRTGTPTQHRSPGPPPPTRSSPRSVWSRPASNNSSATTRSNDTRITGH